MSLAEDVSAVRHALEALQQASVVVSRHYPENVDVRRLRLDVGRLSSDIDLLCGVVPEPAITPPPPPTPRALEVIDDKAYAHDFWMDAEDEGLGVPVHDRH